MSEKRVELQIYEANGSLGLTISRMKDKSGEGYRVFGPKLYGQGKPVRTKELNLSELGRLKKEIEHSMKFLKPKAKAP